MQCLVDDEQPQPRRQTGQHVVAEGWVVEPLRADQQDVHLIGEQLVLDNAHSSRFAELIGLARMPARTAASTWLRINASSGETINVGPAPRARSSIVATKYTADLPQPVR
jgi:hypothetical protein